MSSLQYLFLSRPLFSWRYNLLETVRAHCAPTAPLGLIQVLSAFYMLHFMPSRIMFTALNMYSYKNISWSPTFYEYLWNCDYNHKLGGAAALPQQDKSCLVGSRIDIEAEMLKEFSMIHYIALNLSAFLDSLGLNILQPCLVKKISGICL